MNLKLFCLLMLFIMTSEIPAQQLSSDIFDKIYNYQRSEGDSILAEWFNEIHDSLIKSRKLSFIKKNDTVFIMEKLDLETGICYGAIWNQQKEINYTYYTYPKRKFDFSKRKVFGEHIQNLVSKWDIKNIRCKEEKNTIINSNSVFAFRIVTRDDSTEIDSLRFLEFHGDN